MVLEILIRIQCVDAVALRAMLLEGRLDKKDRATRQEEKVVLSRERDCTSNCVNSKITCMPQDM